MRYVCVHGHFYQPPRENPSLEAIELQDSAYPYHDWNERITAECYAPNATSRILDNEQRIIKLVNNYGMMSFNFGPTLLSWLEAQSAARVCGVARSRQAEFSQIRRPWLGVVAQAYNHMILPLANRRDKVTQVKWGIADFEHRFKRRPEGMWLPETAANTETSGSVGGKRNFVHHHGAAPGETCATQRRAKLEGRQRRPHRSQPRLSGQLAFEKNDQRFFLRRAYIARRGL